MKNSIILGLICLSLTACLSGSVYQVYEGDRRSSLQVAMLEGSQFLRQDWLNRYIDAVRFSHVDGVEIDNSVAYRQLEIEPGYHDIDVYFYWDMGSARGLAPALVSYAASRDTLSRRLRFNALASKRYTVMAEPHFNSERQDVTTLSHVDFWVEDEAGNEIVSRDQGRYFPPEN